MSNDLCQRAREAHQGYLERDAAHWRAKERETLDYICGDDAAAVHATLKDGYVTICGRQFRLERNDQRVYLSHGYQYAWTLENLGEILTRLDADDARQAAYRKTWWGRVEAFFCTPLW